LKVLASLSQKKFESLGVFWKYGLSESLEVVGKAFKSPDSKSGLLWKKERIQGKKISLRLSKFT
jgi:hypothetical protein